MVAENQTPQEPEQTPPPKKADAVLVMTPAKRTHKGRAPILFDYEVVEMLGSLGASRWELATAFKVNVDTINYYLDQEEHAFSQSYRKGLSRLTSKLRYRQIQKAMEGDTRMLTWLGMQLLGQKNVARSEATIDGRVENALTFTIRQNVTDDGVLRTEYEREEQERVPMTVNPAGTQDEEAAG
jgi:hypothetical protein